MIYLMQALHGDLKLGYSKHPDIRLKELRRYPGELKIIALRDGSESQERALHKMLRRTGPYLGQPGGEWYPQSRTRELMGIFGEKPWIRLIKRLIGR